MTACFAEADAVVVVGGDVTGGDVTGGDVTFGVVTEGICHSYVVVVVVADSVEPCSLMSPMSQMPPSMSSVIPHHFLYHFLLVPVLSMLFIYLLVYLPTDVGRACP